MNLVYWLLCILIGAIPAVLVYWSDKHKELKVKWLPALLRWITLSATAALLLAPAFSTEKNEEEKPIIIWLQDNSSSIKKALGQDTTAYKQELEKIIKDLEKEHEVVRLGFGAQLQNDSIFNYQQPLTDISAALNLALDRYEDRNIGALVLASDGVYNQGADPHFLNFKKPVPVYSLALGDSTAPWDAQVKRVLANKVVSKGSSFEIIVDLAAEKLSGQHTVLSLEQGGHTLSQKKVSISRNQFFQTLSFETTAKGSGLQKYSVVLAPLKDEQNTFNNRMDFFVEVIAEEIKILLIAEGPHPDIGAIRNALEALPNYKLDIHYADKLPNNIQDYQMVIAYQLPARQPLSLPEDMPVWYIIGHQSNLPLFNQQQNALHISGLSSPNAVLPVLNNGFSYFTLPENIREVLQKMPPLYAPNGKYSARGQVLFQQQLGNIETQQALWVIQSGTPAVAVLAGEGIWRWRQYEYKNFKQHAVVDALIQQTVSLLQSKRDQRRFRVYLDKYLLNENEPVYLFAELRNENGELFNQPEVGISLTDSMGNEWKGQFEKSGNSYRLNPGLLSSGTWSYRSTVRYNNQTEVAQGSFTIAAIPLEDLRQHSDFNLLSLIASQTEGAFFTRDNMSDISTTLSQNPNIKPVLHSHTAYQSLVDLRWWFAFILLTAAAEWGLRKYWNLN